MPFNIAEFVGEINRGGLVKLAHFAGRVTFPRSMPRGFSREANLGVLPLRIIAMPLPGRTVRATEDFKHGPEKKIGTNVNYPDISTTILSSKNMSEREAILTWQDIIVGDHRKKITINENEFDRGYYDDYVGQLEIDIFDEAGNLTKTCRFEECWPTSISEVEFNWSQEGHVTFNVSWTYNRFYERDIRTAG